MICVDASLVLSWVLPEEISPKAIRARRQWDAKGEQLVAPAFLQVEVTSVLRSAVHRGRISPDEGEGAFRSFRRMAIWYLEPKNLVEDAWMVAQKLNSPRAYDMFYVALAESQACDLWTADERLVNFVGPRSNVRWVGDVELEEPV